eukprot:TRINITY_DN7768_c0_g1_i3.p1 TRINITY_DN7768_c0_g1~~TRINITY_DN7768_c0_g1_i3.p1  ORF type:complete len:2307 (-),score=440.34 TRINITY_DN7768_c0_g1_i3:23-6943(-)
MQTAETPADSAERRHWQLVCGEGSTLSKLSAGTAFAIQGWAHKLGEGLIVSWRKRFFAARWPFVYYFADDIPDTKVQGCLFLRGATIEHAVIKGMTGIFVRQTVPRRPGDREYTFSLGFDDAATRDSWAHNLEELIRKGDRKSKPKDPKEPKTALSANRTASPPPEPTPPPHIDDSADHTTWESSFGGGTILSSLTGAILQGWCSLSAATSDTWERRLLVLRYPFLFYFASDQPSGRSEGCLFLRDAKLGVSDGKVPCVHGQQIVPRCPGEAGRTWALGFSSTQERQRWLDTLLELCQTDRQRRKALRTAAPATIAPPEPAQPPVPPEPIVEETPSLPSPTESAREPLHEPLVAEDLPDLQRKIESAFVGFVSFADTAEEAAFLACEQEKAKHELQEANWAKGMQNRELQTQLDSEKLTTTELRAKVNQQIRDMEAMTTASLKQCMAAQAENDHLAAVNDGLVAELKRQRDGLIELAHVTQQAFLLVSREDPVVQQRIVDLEDLNKKILAETSILKEKLATSENEFDRRLSVKEGDIMTLRRELEMKDQRQMELELENNKLGAQVAQLDRSLADAATEATTAQRDLGSREREAAEEGQRLHAQVASLEEELARLRESFSAVSKAHSHCEEDLKSVRTHASTLQEDNSVLRRQLEDVEAQFDKETARLFGTEKTLEQQKLELERIRAELGTAAARCIALEGQLASKIEDLQRTTEERDRFHSATEDSARNVEELKRQLEGLDAQFQKETEQLAETDRNLNDSQRRHQQAVTENNALHGKVAQLEQALKEIEQAEHETRGRAVESVETSQNALRDMADISQKELLHLGSVLQGLLAAKGELDKLQSDTHTTEIQRKETEDSLLEEIARRKELEEYIAKSVVTSESVPYSQIEEKLSELATNQRMAATTSQIAVQIKTLQDEARTAFWERELAIRGQKMWEDESAQLQKQIAELENALATTDEREDEIRLSTRQDVLEAERRAVEAERVSERAKSMAADLQEQCNKLQQDLSRTDKTLRESRLREEAAQKIAAESESSFRESENRQRDLLQQIDSLKAQIVASNARPTQQLERQTVEEPLQQFVGDEELKKRVIILQEDVDVLQREKVVLQHNIKSLQNYAQQLENAVGTLWVETNGNLPISKLSEEANASDPVDFEAIIQKQLDLQRTAVGQIELELEQTRRELADVIADNALLFEERKAATESELALRQENRGLQDLLANEREKLEAGILHIRELTELQAQFGELSAGLDGKTKEWLRREAMLKELRNENAVLRQRETEILRALAPVSEEGGSSAETVTPVTALARFLSEKEVERENLKKEITALQTNTHAVSTVYIAQLEADIAALLDDREHIACKMRTWLEEDEQSFALTKDISSRIHEIGARTENAVQGEARSKTEAEQLRNLVRQHTGKLAELQEVCKKQEELQAALQKELETVTQQRTRSPEPEFIQILEETHGAEISAILCEHRDSLELLKLLSDKLTAASSQQHRVREAERVALAELKRQLNTTFHGQVSNEPNPGFENSGTSNVPCGRGDTLARSQVTADREIGELSTQAWPARSNNTPTAYAHGDTQYSTAQGYNQLPDRIAPITSSSEVTPSQPTGPTGATANSSASSLCSPENNNAFGHSTSTQSEVPGGPLPRATGEIPSSAVYHVSGSPSETTPTMFSSQAALGSAPSNASVQAWSTPARGQIDVPDTPISSTGSAQRGTSQTSVQAWHTESPPTDGALRSQLSSPGSETVIMMQDLVRAATRQRERCEELERAVVEERVQCDDVRLQLARVERRLLAAMEGQARGIIEGEAGAHLSEISLTLMSKTQQNLGDTTRWKEEEHCLLQHLDTLERLRSFVGKLSPKVETVRSNSAEQERLHERLRQEVEALILHLNQTAEQAALEKSESHQELISHRNDLAAQLKEELISLEALRSQSAQLSNLASRRAVSREAERAAVVELRKLLLSISDETASASADTVYVSTSTLGRNNAPAARAEEHTIDLETHRSESSSNESGNAIVNPRSDSHMDEEQVFQHLALAASKQIERNSQLESTIVAEQLLGDELRGKLATAQLQLWVTEEGCRRLSLEVECMTSLLSVAVGWGCTGVAQCSKVQTTGRELSTYMQSELDKLRDEISRHDLATKMTNAELASAKRTAQECERKEKKLVEAMQTLRSEFDRKGKHCAVLQAQVDVLEKQLAESNGRADALKDRLYCSKKRCDLQDEMLNNQHIELQQLRGQFLFLQNALTDLQKDTGIEVGNSATPLTSDVDYAIATMHDITKALRRFFQETQGRPVSQELGVPIPGLDAGTGEV